MSSPLRQRLGLAERGDAASLGTMDGGMAARALMYLLAGVGTAIVASVAVPGGPLEHQTAVPVLAGIAYAAAIGVFFGFDKLPRWGFHALLLSVTAAICWAVYQSGEAGSPYKVFFFWVCVYAAMFMTPVMVGFHITVMVAAYAGILIALGDKAQDASLHWALTSSALILIGIAIQALNVSVRRLVDRLTEVGRADSLTGLYNSEAFTEMLENEVERARRSGNRMGLVVGEVDGFTPVGGGTPSAAQQRLLTTIGEVLHTVPRQIDMAARLGGGRFALVLPYTDEHGAFLVAERVRAALGGVEAIDGLKPKMSFGVAGFPRHGATGPAVLQASETALDEAREAGGDRVMLFQRTSSGAVVEVTATEELG